MTQEEKRLLLKELCARLPYGVRVKIFDKGVLSVGNNEKGVLDGKETMSDDYFVIKCHTDSWLISCEDFKPYLRPIKSMTQKECDELFRILNIDENNGEWLKINDIGVIRLFTELGKDFYEIADAIDYLYSIHVDFRGMIEKGLALEATEGMYKTE